ncbi:sigma factor [Proteiniclasticum sp. C24MP]|uniref:sigma factor n=1 Tax=Proteiniclasticum sp. C24MP TaxID=3374101 RepID=UPI003754D8AA
MREIDQMAVEAVEDEHMFSNLIERQERFILKTSSKIARRYVTKNDDEWSVAIGAFSQAVQKYDYNQGSFLFFAERIIRQRMVDHYRANGRFSVEIPVDFIEEEAIVEENDQTLKLEIEAVTEVLEAYGFSFMDLLDCSPKAKKTRSACAAAVNYLMNQPILLREMRASKQLPLKEIVKNTGVPRKILERHRKYLIAAVEILYGEYPFLSEYLKYLKEERAL